MPRPSPFAFDAALRRCSRLSRLAHPAPAADAAGAGDATRAADAARVAEVAILAAAGFAAAAATTFVRAPLHIPGHALVLAALPLGCGLALVPRRGAGTLMGLAAALAAAALGAAGAHLPGPGALAGLVVFGPAMDGALRVARGGARAYVALAGAGAATNLIAFAVRGGAKALAAPLGARALAGARSLAQWLSVAPYTYAAAGALAGLLAAVAWFGRGRREQAGA